MINKKSDSSVKSKKASAKTGDSKTGKKKGGLFQVPRGMHDILPIDWLWWDRVEKVIDDLAERYNFGRIETPILENSGLFQTTIGKETDIVRKEMYTLKTKGSDLLALRPEGTAPIARAYIENRLSSLSQPQKLFYYGPMFRHERPQRGRFRQFYQAGFEIIGGNSDSVYDAQVILIFDRLLRALKIKEVELSINSVGCRICRPNYKRQLQIYYKRHEKDLCADCSRRLKDNPLRILDCKKESCQSLKEKAPSLLDKICAGCTRHFKAVLECLDELEVPYRLDNYLVRGLDYYSKTVFEFFSEGVDVGALPAGGRYDYLIEAIGGRPTPAVGGAVGIERLVEVMRESGIRFPGRLKKEIFFIHVGELAKKKSLKVIEELRSAGIAVAEALGKESVKSQLRVADKKNVTLALIFGQREVYEKSIIIRDLKLGLQESVTLDKMTSEVKKRLKIK